MHSTCFLTWDPPGDAKGIQSHQPGRWRLYLPSVPPLKGGVSALTAQGFLTEISGSGPNNRTRSLPATACSLQGHGAEVSVMFRVCSDTSPGQAELSAPSLTEAGVVFPLGQLPGLWTCHSLAIKREDWAK